MKTKHILALISLLSLFPLVSQAKSPWDREPVAAEPAPATTPADPVMAEPVDPQAIPAEPEIVEPVAAEPIAPPEPVAAESAPADVAPVQPVAAEPVMAEPAAASEPAAPIEIIETTGDVLAMPQPGASQADTSPILLLDFPRRGMDQEKVQSELGKPLEIKDAVGQPPISRWIYNDRVVYFERNTVIHVVAR